jgi:hypothetical protein
VSLIEQGLGRGLGRLGAKRWSGRDERERAEEERSHNEPGWRNIPHNLAMATLNPNGEDFLYTLRPSFRSLPLFLVFVPFYLVFTGLLLVWNLLDSERRVSATSP